MNIVIKPGKFFLSDFVKANKDKIDTITPKNPMLKQDDEWMKEDFWDDLYREKTDK